MNEPLRQSLLSDINSGYEDIFNYPKLDITSLRVLWWHLAIYALLVYLVCVVNLANLIPSPLSWRVIPLHDGILALLCASLVTLIPTALHRKLRPHYLFRLIITAALITYSYLLIYITGGGVAMHAHTFIVIGFISIYADWRLVWFAFSMAFFNNIFLGTWYPDWLYFYGYNPLSLLIDTVLLSVMAGLMTVLCNNYRQALLAQKEIELRKDEFISAASHELKTPITSQKAFIQLLQQQLLINKDRQYYRLVHRISDQTDKIINLVNDLLDLSRIQTGKLIFNKEAIDLNRLVRQLARDYEQTEKHHKIVVKGHLNRRIIADQVRLAQVITNLLSNAAKYSPDANRINVTINQRTRRAVVMVQDFGIGIDKEHRQAIFDRFYRVSGSNEQTYPGLGIGLYVCAQIIRRLGGRLWVESIKGEGSKFYFSLPLHH